MCVDSMFHQMASSTNNMKSVTIVNELFMANFLSNFLTQTNQIFTTRKYMYQTRKYV